MYMFVQVTYKTVKHVFKTQTSMNLMNSNAIKYLYRQLEAAECFLIFIGLICTTAGDTCPSRNTHHFFLLISHGRCKNVPL